MADFTRALLGMIGCGLAMCATSSPASAQQARVLPSDPQDFQCFTLMQDRRDAFLANRSLDEARRAEFVNNLTIISGFYAGRLSHYSAADAQTQFQSARSELDAATPQQRDAFANICTDFYLSVMTALTSQRQPDVPAAQ